MNYENEIWKTIEEYPQYQVSNMGRVRSLKHKAPRILKLADNDYGYLVVHLYPNGKQKTIKVHRLVAKAFVPNPDNLPTTDHIDRDRKNNFANNLRWADYSEQNNNRSCWGTDVKTKVKCVETEEIFDNALKAAEWIVNQDLSISIASEVAKRIRTLCRGNGGKTAYGYHWEFYYGEVSL